MKNQPSKEALRLMILHMASTSLPRILAKKEKKGA